VLHVAASVSEQTTHMCWGNLWDSLQLLKRVQG